MGIVKKNSILLVTSTNEQAGADARDGGAFGACPIRCGRSFMTSVATITAAIRPLALGPGAETRVPMALVIIGGVTVSTLLTLLSSLRLQPDVPPGKP